MKHEIGDQYELDTYLQCTCDKCKDWSKYGKWFTFEPEFINECPAMGDLNGDGGYNVLDIVALANCILANNCDQIENGCAGDINGDEWFNILDIVQLANCILSATCDCELLGENCD